ncbi:MAG: YfhO family protein, partial [Flavisolibacter sp.]
DSNTRKVIFANPYAYFAREITQQLSIYPATGIAFSNDQRLLNINEPGKGEFVLKKLSANSFHFSTKNNAEAVFILQQLHLPGWTSTIDGQKTDIMNVNTAFMGVRLEEGNHRILFEYQPAGIREALILSLVTVLIVILLLLNPYVRETRK